MRNFLTTVLMLALFASFSILGGCSTHGNIEVGSDFFYKKDDPRTGMPWYLGHNKGTGFTGMGGGK